MRYSHAFENLFAALSVLGTSRRSPRERLADAYLNNLLHLRRQEFPPPIRAEVDALHLYMSRASATAGEGTVAATARAMTPREVAKAVEMIIRIFSAVAREAIGEHTTSESAEDWLRGFRSS